MRRLYCACLCLATIFTRSTLRAGGIELPLVELPLTKVVLFSTGVGFFLHEGAVDESVAVELPFAVENVNDLLKSVVLQDLNGGRVLAVSYPVNDPLEKSLKKYAIDLSHDATLGQFLARLRGERVRLELKQGQPDQIEGKILGVERRRVLVGAEAVDQDFVSLVNEQGLQSVSLTDVKNALLLDNKLRGELESALDLVASSHAPDNKNVRFEFRGKGRRQVRIGYVQLAPVWKTTYRLVLNADRDPLLQGWAIVENTTDREWNQVKLTLVSGKPLSFLMNLYEPLFAPRPLLEPETFKGLFARPFDNQGGLNSGMGGGGMGGGGMGGGGMGGGGMGGGGNGGLGGGAGGGFFDISAGGGAEQREPDADGASDRPLGWNGESAAVGKLFRYELEAPVTLPQQKSALLPIVNQKIQGERISYFYDGLPTEHPLLAVRFTNSTDLHLLQGPMTVFDRDEYAGDGHIADTAPGKKRLVSYSVDVELSVATKSAEKEGQTTRVDLVGWELTKSRIDTETLDYTIVNQSKSDRLVVLEQHRPDSNDEEAHDGLPKKALSQPKTADETTKRFYRFDVQSGAGKTTSFKTVYAQPGQTTISLSEVDSVGLRAHAEAHDIPKDISKVIQQIAKLREAVEMANAKLNRLSQEAGTLVEEQKRISELMVKLQESADLYKRYATKLDLLETRLEANEKSRRAAAEEMNDAVHAVEAYKEKR